MKNPRDIAVVTPGYNYKMPFYQVGPEGPDAVGETGLQFCRGDKSDPSKPRQDGVFVESLLEICRHRLFTVNTGELASRETSVAITKIEEAIMWLEKRSSDRRVRGVEGTYQK